MGRKKGQGPINNQTGEPSEVVGESAGLRTNPDADGDSTERFDLDVLFVECQEAKGGPGEELLERLGCRVHRARDGVEALERLGIQPDNLESIEYVDRYWDYDLMMMDSHMPRMDGTEACGLLRSMESAWIAAQRISEGSRLPVIAMMVTDVKGAREFCLAAGMDACLGKPFSRVEVCRILNEVSSRCTHRERRAERIPPLQFDEKPDMRFEYLLEMVDGNEELAAELSRDFISVIPEALTALREALSRSEGDGAARQAHKIAGSASYMGAVRMQEIAKAMERLGRSGDLQPCIELLVGLERSYQEVARLFSEKWPAAADGPEIRGV
ncbi:MAG: Hpt domain-containing protein [Kiritimatiellae bacterium]|nr:Hpt domain-containing protein [Kiritimatiellia bacterium]